MEKQTLYIIIFIVVCVLITILAFIKFHHKSGNGNSSNLKPLEYTSRNIIRYRSGVNKNRVYNASLSGNSSTSDEAPVNPRDLIVTTPSGYTFVPAMGTIPRLAMGAPIYHAPVKSFPNNYDGFMKDFPDCRNQRNCGSCWAFATTEMLEHRLVVATKGKWKGYALKHGDPRGGWLSVQYIVSCVRDSNEMGCQGAGELQEVVRHLVEGRRDGAGLYLNAVYPYEEDNTGESGSGDTTCKNFPNKPRFNFKNSYAVSNGKDSKDEGGIKRNIDLIKQDIMKNGSVVTAMYVFNSFMDINTSNNTPSTPYEVDPNGEGKGKPLGGHAVVIVGWGTIPGKDASDYKNQYWILRNSWGSGWNHNGYWYWRMGDDLQGFIKGDNIMIEYGCVAGQPETNNSYIKQVMGSNPKPGGGGGGGCVLF